MLIFRPQEEKKGKTNIICHIICKNSVPKYNIKPMRGRLWTFLICEIILLLLFQQIHVMRHVVNFIDLLLIYFPKPEEKNLHVQFAF